MLQLATLIFYLCTVGSNPGILPRTVRTEFSDDVIESEGEDSAKHAGYKGQVNGWSYTSTYSWQQWASPIQTEVLHHLCHTETRESLPLPLLRKLRSQIRSSLQMAGHMHWWPQLQAVLCLPTFHYHASVGFHWLLSLSHHRSLKNLDDRW